MTGGGEWKVKVQHSVRRNRRWVERWIEYGPMSYWNARDEGRRCVREGHNARLVDPDGREGPLITLPATSPPATTRKHGVELQLSLFPR